MIEDGQLTLKIPELSLEMFRWWHLLVAMASYGLFTHFVSLPGIHRYNKKLIKASDDKNPKIINQLNLLAILPLRMTLVPIWRAVCLTAGTIYIPISFLTTGIPKFGNDAMKEGWLWYCSPETLSKEFDSRSAEARHRDRLSGGSKYDKVEV